MHSEVLLQQFAFVSFLYLLSKWQYFQKIPWFRAYITLYFCCWLSDFRVHILCQSRTNLKQYFFNSSNTLIQPLVLTDIPVYHWMITCQAPRLTYKSARSEGSGIRLDDNPTVKHIEWSYIGKTSRFSESRVVFLSISFNISASKISHLNWAKNVWSK